ncbi:MAG: helix-turn-helix transcriptional regulator [Rickettsiales bacterium]
MTLLEYINHKKITQAAFARYIGESPQNIERYVNGKRLPRKKTIDKIISATDGLVSYHDFYLTHKKPLVIKN